MLLVRSTLPSPPHIWLRACHSPYGVHRLSFYAVLWKICRVRVWPSSTSLLSPCRLYISNEIKNPEMTVCLVVFCVLCFVFCVYLREGSDGGGRRRQEKEKKMTALLVPGSVSQYFSYLTLKHHRNRHIFLLLFFYLLFWCRLIIIHPYHTV